MLVVDERAIFQGKCDMYQEEVTGKKASKPSAKATRAGKKSAKAAIAEALKEVEEENRSQEEQSAVAETKEEANQYIISKSLSNKKAAYAAFLLLNSVKY